MGTHDEYTPFVVDGDGKMFRLTSVPQVELSQADGCLPDFLTSTDASFTCTLSFVMKHRKGYFDCIFGRHTPAARRYLRSCKRRKEHLRRMKLKEAV